MTGKLKQLSLELAFAALCTIWLTSSAGGSEENKKKDYNNFKVLRVYPTNKQHVDLLHNLAETYDPDVDFWVSPSYINRSVDIMLSTERRLMVEELLSNNSIQKEVMIENVAKAIEIEQGFDENDELVGRSPPTFFSSYHRLDEIHKYMKSLESKYPKLASTFSIGKSFEGQDLLVLKIRSGKDTKKPIIWIDGGTHGREWITSATALYVATKLLDEYDLDDNVTKLLEFYEWYIHPVVNPDGYEYSHTTDRMWRKTRSWTISLIGCRGVDPNRNWPFKWNYGGASISPCSYVYSGLIPFTEPEIKAIANFIFDHKKRVKLFLTLHSYSQMWLTPWGWTNELPSDYTDQVKIGTVAVRALRSLYGTSFKIGSTSELLCQSHLPK
ncbi:carboxypeptidase B-like isoform X2 [Tachypleus tridentatus]|uniref:carboxypeptidase B-like isoform X2 n=1 Tax=Tachypleus tridentatus TaxID=6853 RepID=UPI003FD54713